MISQLLTFELLALLFTAIIIKIIWSRRKLYRLSLNLPGPNSLPIIGNAHNIGMFSAQRGMINKILGFKNKYGDLFRIWMGPELCIVLSEPSDIECVLLCKQAAFKGKKYDMLAKYIGHSLLAASGPIWKKHRNILNPSFSIISTKQYQTFNELYAKYLIDNLMETCNNGPVDVRKYTLRWAADNLFDGLFDCKANFYNGKLDHVLFTTADIGVLIHERMCKIWLESDFLYQFTKSGIKMKKLYTIYVDFYYEHLRQKFQPYINNNKQSTVMDYKDDNESSSKLPKTPTDVLSKALSEGQLQMEDIYAAFNNIWNAGLDTLYTSLSFFMLMMGMHKRCQDLIWNEIKTVFSDELDAPVTSAELSQMSYLDLCLKEISRLFPTGPIQFRRVDGDFILKTRNMIIPEGTTILISNFLLHRDPKYWDSPNLYIPERFLPENSLKRPHFSYIPFSAGLRNCIGQAFGVDTLKTAAIHILRNFELKSNLKMENLPVHSDISVRSTLGYFLEIKKRDRQ